MVIASLWQLAIMICDRCIAVSVVCADQLDEYPEDTCGIVVYVL